MAECNLGFAHEEPEPVVVQEAPDTEPIAEAEVRIAEVNANRDVAVAKIQNRALDEETVTSLAALQARIDVLEAARMPQEQEQAQVVMEAPEPQPEPAEPAPVPKDEAGAPEAPKSSKRSAWWG